MVINIKENKNLNKLINLSSKLLNLLYILFIVGIILVGIKIIKELNIINFIYSIFCLLSPLFIGFIIAWLFNPLVKKLNSKGIPKVLCAILIYIALILLVFIFFRIFIPVVYKQLNDLIISLPNIINKISSLLDNIVTKFNVKGIDVRFIKDNILNCINNNIVKITTSIPKHMVSFLFSFLGYIGVISLGLVVGIYMLIDFDHITNHFINLIPYKNKKEIIKLMDKISTEVRKTINGTLLVALMVLVCDTTAFSVIGLESPLLFGLLCGLTDLIPYIGPYIGGTAAVTVGFTESTGVGVAVLISCVIVQLVENYIFQPVVMSKTIEIHPITIIIGLLLFGHFFGIMGMIVASPIIALIKVIYDFLKIKYIS